MSLHFVCSEKRRLKTGSSLGEALVSNPKIIDRCDADEVAARLNFGGTNGLCLPK